MDTDDEIPLEDHRFFRARLEHLETQHPVAMLAMLESGTLTQHLRTVTLQALKVLAALSINQNLPLDQAEELVISRIVADPHEQSRLATSADCVRLSLLLSQYKAVLPEIVRTYQSQIETTE